jgi:hypothetical protein
MNWRVKKDAEERYDDKIDQPDLSCRFSNNRFEWSFIRVKEMGYTQDLL